MSAFKDELGREWNVRLDVTTNSAIRNRLGLDFINLESAGAALARIESDGQLLFDAVWLVVAPHAKDRGVSIEDFGRSMGGDYLSHALTAMREAVINFLQPRERETAQATLTILTGLRTELLANSVLTLGS